MGVLIAKRFSGNVFDVTWTEPDEVHEIPDEQAMILLTQLRHAGFYEVSREGTEVPVTVEPPQEVVRSTDAMETLPTTDLSEALEVAHPVRARRRRN